jgi:hypothetical protein
VDTGRRLSADLVITGDLLRFGTSLKIQLKLEDTHTGLVVGEAEVSGGSIDDLDAKLQPGVAQLFKKLIDRRAALEARARTAEEQERKKTEAQERQRQAAEAKAEKRAEQDRELQVERERREQETRLAEARASATGFGGFGLYGGFAWDPKAKALGEEAGLRLGLGAGWSLAGGVVVAPQLAGRVVLAKGLFGTEDFSVSFGLRGFFSPLAEGTVLGGGGGLKLSVPLFQYLTLYGWFAVEAYKTVSETVVAPLLVSGLEIHL